jgi:hypothetical protein
MQIFVDESGSFAGFHDRSISAVGALAIPDGKLQFLTKKFAKLRARLPLENGEVKGRLLKEGQIDEVVALLARNEALFEVSVVDLGMHNEAEVQAYKEKHGKEMLAKVSDFAEAVRPQIQKASEEILKMPVQLYLQALTTFELLHRLIGYMTMYFSQRWPGELGKITWVVDGKDRQKVTRWEEWWSHYAQGALATMSKRRPMPRLPKLATGDYSFYDKSYGPIGDDGEKGIDLKRLLKDIRFSADSEPGLEFVDILANAIRRTLIGNLGRDGWQNIKGTMVHRNEGPYIQFLLFREGADVVQRAPYAKVVHDGFSTGGKLMLTKRNTVATQDEAARPPG